MSADSEILTQLTEAVSKLTNNALSTTKIQAVAVKLPEFWTDDPDVEVKPNYYLKLPVRIQLYKEI